MFSPNSDGKSDATGAAFLLALAVGFGLVMGVFTQNDNLASAPAIQQATLQRYAVDVDKNPLPLPGNIKDPAKDLSVAKSSDLPVESSATEEVVEQKDTANDLLQEKSDISVGEKTQESAEPSPEKSESFTPGLAAEVAREMTKENVILPLIASVPIGIEAEDIGLQATIYPLPESSIKDDGNSVSIEPPFTRHAVHWWAQSGLAGVNSTDSVIIFGHNSVNFGDYAFSRLGSPDSKPGMEIVISTANGPVKYIVTDVKRGVDRDVLLGDSSVQDYKPGYNDLVLVTCDNVSFWGHSTENIVVMARLA